MRKINNLIKFLRQYPYNTLSGKFLILDYLLLRLLSKASFPNMSIIPFVKKEYKLDSDEEFRSRYYFSRAGAEKLWNGCPRNDRTSIEHFYQEHDLDIWRQAQFSKYDYDCKKKTLHIFHVLKSSVKKSDPILDFGCGAGVLFHYLYTRGFIAVDAADIPSQTLNFVLKYMPRFTRRIINLETEQLSKDYYAAIVAVDCLEHTTEPLQITKNLIESLGQGGLFIVKFPRETDFSWTHIKQAQEQRDATFDFIKKSCKTIVPEFVYRKI